MSDIRAWKITFASMRDIATSGSPAFLFELDGTVVDSVYQP
jgi:hypothetical protein